jgi:hypothetical protein
MALLLVLAMAAPAAAQDADDPNTGALTLSGGVDFTNAYMFRGIRQEGDEELVTWPFADLGIALYSGDGGLRSVGVNVGTWNSLHTGSSGLDSLSGKLWYESDFYATLGLGFGGGVSLGTTYTAYTSPNNSFATVKELSFKLGVDDSAVLGKASVKPYALVAVELGDDGGQADAGSEPGTYLELGVAPGYATDAVSLAVPVKVGLSLSDYYEFGLEDETFGYFSIGGLVTVPIPGAPSYGSWNVHVGVEYQKYGDSVKVYNGRDDKAVVWAGFGFTY